MDNMFAQAGRPTIYPPEMRQMMRNHLVGAFSIDGPERKMGAYFHSEYDRILDLWLSAETKDAPHIAPALTVAWLTSCALTYTYLVEDILEATPAYLVEEVGNAIFEIENTVKSTGDWAWAAHIGEMILIRLLDMNRSQPEWPEEN